MSTLVGVVMILVGLALVVFRDPAANVINRSDEDMLGGRSRPLGASSAFSVLLSGLGLIGFGAWIVYQAMR